MITSQFLYLNLLRSSKLAVLYKSIREQKTLLQSVGTDAVSGKTEIRVGFPAWAHNLMLKAQSKQCNTNTQLFVDFSTIKSFWCLNIVNTLCFEEVLYGTTDKRHSKCLKRVCSIIGYGIRLDAVGNDCSHRRNSPRLRPAPVRHFRRDGLS